MYPMINVSRTIAIFSHNAWDSIQQIGSVFRGICSMQGGAGRTSSFSNRILLGLFNCCLPGSCNSRAKLRTEMAEPVVIPPRSKHTASIIFLHGLGDTGHGWSSVFADEIRHDHIKYICPHAPTRAVTLNFGMQMPAWYDLYGLTPNVEEDEEGINESTMIVHSLIDAEIEAGIPSERVMVGGFSMGGALALYSGLIYDKPLAGIIGLSSFLVQRTKLPGGFSAIINLTGGKFLSRWSAQEMHVLFQNHTANKNVQIFMGHGGQDCLVPLSFGQMTEAYIKNFNPNINMKVYPRMAHSSCPEINWLTKLAMRGRSYIKFIILQLCSLFPIEQGFYVPGVAPVEFRDGDLIEVKGIKITSTKTVVPYEYYSLPFCRPQGAIHYISENLGEVMRGDRIVNTPFVIYMKQNVKCNTTCSSRAPLSLSPENSENLAARIKEEYHVHLLVDNLPCTTRYQIENTDEVIYENGYRLGWEEDDRFYVNNHLDIILRYHQPRPDVYRVVGFEVQPQSIDSSRFKFGSDSLECSIVDGRNQEVIKGTNNIIWTYSVTWEESDIPWASRWDAYLSMKDVQIHCVIIIRTVRRDIAKYNKGEELDDTLEESGWKLVHGDVFRPPPSSMLLVNFIGTGIQLIGMVAITVFFAMLGMLSPASRGSLMSAAIVLFCLMGLVAGYHAGRLYRTLRGTSPRKCAFRTAVLFPSIILGTGFLLNFFLIGKHSSGAIPFTTMIALLLLWFGVDLPLLFLGFHFGYRKQAYSHPVRTNQIPRQVPEQPWYLHTLPCMLLAGILPIIIGGGNLSLSVVGLQFMVR
uniref:Transmembrane 9 superfamily member n=1 Tax=Setaria digitata TaxID=48799 RepID=A0A915Q0X6_9BILA